MSVNTDKKYVYKVDKKLIDKCDTIDEACAFIAIVHSILVRTPEIWQKHRDKLEVRISSNVWDVITFHGKYNNSVYCDMSVVVDYDSENEIEIRKK